MHIAKDFLASHIIKKPHNETKIFLKSKYDLIQEMHYLKNTKNCQKLNPQLEKTIHMEIVVGNSLEF